MACTGATSTAQKFHNPKLSDASVIPVLEVRMIIMLVYSWKLINITRGMLLMEFCQMVWMERRGVET